MPHDAPQPLLDVAGIAAGYRRLQVLWGVDLVVHEHESVVLLRCQRRRQDDAAQSDHEPGRGLGRTHRFR
jgi:hypothetical protein